MQNHQRVAIVGVTGFLGRGLPALFAEKGISATGISRAGNGQLSGIDRWQSPETLDFSAHHAVVCSVFAFSNASSIVPTM